jgi:hypothetical protein
MTIVSAYLSLSLLFFYIKIINNHSTLYKYRFDRQSLSQMATAKKGDVSAGIRGDENQIIPLFDIHTGIENPLCSNIPTPVQVFRFVRKTRNLRWHILCILLSFKLLK